MIVTIHQPEHMPWLGFFNKAINSDLFVILDSVQYEKNYFQNRNNIIDIEKQGRQLITVPVNKGSHNDLINEKLISFTSKLKRRYFLKIEKQYRHYPFYHDMIKQIKYKFDNNERLADLNHELIVLFFNYLNIKCSIIKSSELLNEKIKPGGVVNYSICKKLSATHYLSGISGKNYLDITPFKSNNIKVIYQDFRHPKYKQPVDTFIDRLSILDIIFSFSPETCLSLIKSGYNIKHAL